jgi:hypothetical protein
MSRYQHLPLYDALYRYTNEFYKLKKALPKDLKHDLGEAVSNSGLRCLKLIVFADGNKKKSLKGINFAIRGASVHILIQAFKSAISVRKQ